uniref:Pancreatic lipase-related protein 2 n=1 Tax=Lygus hesperus TaxID=30085 RepID=A0A0A9Z9A4_LYGHE
MIWFFGVHLIWLFIFSFASAQWTSFLDPLMEGVQTTGYCGPANNMFPTDFHLRTRKHFNLSSATADQKGKIFGNHLRPDRDVVVIIHEYLRGCDKAFSVDTTKVYLKARPKVQVVTVCWSAGFTSLESQVGMTVGAAVGYGPSTRLVPCVGDLVAKFLKRIHQESHVPWNRITLVAHSLGTQISGDAGNKLGGRKIKKIIALDPAVPLYGVDGITASLLGPKSAKQVIVLHTSQGQYNMGTADFYANTATQPGCEKYSVYTQFTEAFTCSHTRSFKYFIESVLNPHAFPARKCASYDKVKDGKCENKNSTYFGPDTEVIGTYHFTTKPDKPYY